MDRNRMIGVVLAMGLGASAAAQMFTDQRYSITPIESVATLAPGDHVIGDRVGEALAMNDRYLVIGAPGTESDGVSNAGVVYVYDAQTNALLHTLASPTPGTDDEFGAAVALDGDLIGVGCRNDDELVTDGGAVFLFDAVSGDLIEKLTPSFPEEVDRFGFSVAISESYICVGVANDDDAGTNVGSVEVFDRATSARLGKLLPDDPTGINGLGLRVAISGDRVIAGAAPSDINGINAGAVLVFDPGTMSHLYTVQGSDTAPGDEFGGALAVVPGGFVVGSEYNDSDGARAGAVYLFDLETGQQRVRLRPHDFGANYRFGSALYADGDRLIIGAKRNGSDQNNGGRAYLFNARTGQLQAYFRVPDVRTNDQVGVAVAVSGDSVVVAAARANGDSNPAGQVYRFEIGPERYPDRIFEGEDCSNNNYNTLGYAIDIDGEYLVASGIAAGKCIANETGGFYIYHIPTMTAVDHVAQAAVSNDDNFGWSVAAGDGVVALGAPTDSIGRPNSGAVHLYETPTGAAMGVMVLNDLGQGDQFGYSVDIDQRVLAVGSIYGDANGEPEAGVVHLVDLQRFTVLHRLEDPTPGRNDRFGFDVYMRDGILLVGSPGADDRSPGSGAVFVFDVETGALLKTLVGDEATADLGMSVFTDGEYVLAGDPNADVGLDGGDTAYQAGEVLVFDLSSGQEVARLHAKNPAQFDRFGWSLGMDADTIYIGMRGDIVASGGEISEPLIERFDRSTFERLDPMLPSYSSNQSWFGASIATSEDYIAAGMPNSYPGGDTFELGGAVFVYDRSQPETCPADFNADGVLNFFDVSAFIVAFSSDDPSADFTGDGVLNFFDVSGFIVAYTNGCP